MTKNNEQIIIDGVDVSGCEHRCDTHKTLLADGHIMEFNNYCQITNDGCYAIDCYYKQLKRKEQECEELKQFLSKEPLAIQALQSAYSDYKKRSEVFFEMIGEYKQTLAEIKEFCIDHTQLIHDAYPYLNIILDKINEVEDD